ncbi:MAG: tetratricopeptide repeat protein [Dechloromonas sp.]|nr:tetratricopeptide repeat protein [Candidatus Dechloromonas phosphoritropha]MBP8787254.1 tetratricopeptide repeat protein [Azonexus sp.]
MSESSRDEFLKERDAPLQLGVAEALALAIHIHRLGEYEDAEKLYRRILDVAPDNADAMHFLGILLHHRGCSEDAVELIGRSITLEPGVADRYNNLGNVLVECGRAVEAAKAYRQALALQSDHVDAWNNLGAALRALGEFNSSAAAYRKAIDFAPEQPDAYNNMGNLLSGRGQIKEAVAYYCKAITLTPHHPEARRLLGIAYYTLGQTNAAAEVFRSWLVDEPDNPIAKHMYAACSGHGVPERAPDDYVELTFDGFAASFDAKLGRLDYCAPQLVAEAVARACGTPAGALDGLDAGCGTGLCGPLIAPYVRHLTGVDLSAGMLDRARSRSVYAELVKDELTAHLRRRSNAFDLIVSADTLVYFGSLEAVSMAAASALRPDGLLVFTVEEAFDDTSTEGYRINPHGRYSHHRGYVARILSDSFLVVEAIDSAVLRREGGSAVKGLVVTARKPVPANLAKGSS